MVSSQFVRWSALGGMVGTALFLPVTFIIGSAQEGYDPVSQHISALSESGATNGWAQTVSFIVLGLLTVGLAAGLHRGISDGQGSVIGPTLIGVFGMLAGVGNGIFPADPIGAPETTVGTLHELTAAVGFTALIAAMFVLPRRLQQDDAWMSLATPSRWTGALAAVLMLLFLFAAEIEGFLDGYSGAAQRLFAVTVLAWLFVLSLRLLKVSKIPEPSAHA